MKIALVGLAPLQAFGLTEVFRDRWPEHEIIVHDEPAYSSLPDVDRYIVSSAAMAAYARFLMPRLSEILLLTTSMPISGDHNSLPCLSPLAPMPEILKRLENLLCSTNTKFSHHTLSEHPAKPDNFKLTTRELDVLKEIVKGLSVKEIATALGISVNTVLTHRKNLAEKTGVHSAPALVYFAMKYKLI